MDKESIILLDFHLFCCSRCTFQDIKSLFPPDYNPFYAGFGNRDTDELSYRKIGIPKGKIFIINPKVFIRFLLAVYVSHLCFHFHFSAEPVLSNWQGEVAINNRIDVKSYTSLHTLVHDMFPPTSLVEQVMSDDDADEEASSLPTSHFPSPAFRIPDILFPCSLWNHFALMFMMLCRKILTRGITGKCHCQILIASKRDVRLS